MDLRVSRAIVVAYLLGGLLIGTIVYQAYRSSVERELGARDAANSSVGPGEPGEPPQFVLYRRGAPGRRVPGSNANDADRGDEAARIARLREILEQRDAILREREDQVRVQKEKNVELERQTNQYVAMYLNLLAQEIQGAATTFELADDPLLDEGLPSEAIDLESQLAERVTQLELELAEARWERDQARDWITDLQTATEHDGERLRRAEAVMVGAGASSVPGLVVLLQDTDPLIRRWAASVLGRIGPDAIESYDALTTALRDPDENVRAAAKAAIESIEGRL